MAADAQSPLDVQRAAGTGSESRTEGPETENTGEQGLGKEAHFMAIPPAFNAFLERVSEFVSA